jgi:L-aminopeptidase/D-esterase-like protein
LVVAALFAVNASGDILSEQGQILAGIRQPPEGKQLADSLVVLREIAPKLLQTGNTVIGVVATNARLSKDEINKVAQMAQDGLARAVRPAHTPFDGDTIFALATGTHPAHPAVIGTFAAEVTAQAIRQGVLRATSLDGIPAAQDLLS